VCKYMCPYARFQSAMFDRDTLIIGYDGARGEPRKGAAKKLAELGPRPTTGDCIDCSICVQVCPMGIDIRQGLQYECIACAACVDGCNEVMDSVGKPRGLIRYTSERQEAGGGRLHWWRPRALGYGVVWAAVCAGFVAAVLLRNPLELDVIRYRTSLYRQLPGGAIENLYTIKVANKDSRAHAFELDVTLADGRELEAEPDEFELAAGETRSITVAVRTDDDDDSPGPVSAARFALQSDDDPRIHIERKASFLAGERR